MNRPDLDRDAERLYAQQNGTSDLFDLRRVADINDDKIRPLVLAHWASACLHRALYEDLIGLTQRGLRGLPVIKPSGVSLGIHAADGARVAWCLQDLRRPYVEIIFSSKEQDHLVPCAVRRLTPGLATFSADVRRSADEIRAFVLHGEVPGANEEVSW